MFHLHIRKNSETSKCCKVYSLVIKEYIDLCYIFKKIKYLFYVFEADVLCKV